MRWLAALCMLFVATMAAAQHGGGGIFNNGPLVQPAVTGGDPTSGLLLTSNDAFTNWTMAGLQSIGGIPTRSTVCNTLSPSGGTDTTAINNAIAACPVGQVLMLAAGTFSILENQQIDINKGITLRGTGNCTNGSAPFCQTVITVSNGAVNYVGGDVCGNSESGPSTGGCTNQSTVILGPAKFTDTWSGCLLGTFCAAAVSLTADAAQGDTTIAVADTTKFTVGTWMLIDEFSNSGYVTDPMTPTSIGQVYASSDAMSSSSTPATGRVIWQKHNPSQGNDDFSSGSDPNTATGGQACAWSYCNRPISEIHHVTARSASSGAGTITVDSPLTIAYRISGIHAAKVYWPTNGTGTTQVPFIEQAGLENISIQRATNGSVTINQCAYCWVKNVEARWWVEGLIMAYAVRPQVEEYYSHDCADAENNGNEYGIDIQFATTEALVTNSIAVQCGKPMTVRGSGAGTVIAYNVLDRSYYIAASVGNGWEETQANTGHSAGSHHVLVEGNWTPNLDTDDTHGNEIYMTYFRNRASDFRTSFTDPSTGQTVDDANGVLGTGPFRAAGPMAYNYWHAFIGNVLGTSGKTTAGNGYINQGLYGQSSKNIWMAGWLNWWAASPGQVDSNLSSFAGTAFTERHANFDYLSNSVTYATGFSHTLPNSFYAASAPSFFGASGANCIYAWPWVTPQNGTLIQPPTGASCTATAGLPAEARLEAGTPFVQP